MNPLEQLVADRCRRFGSVPFDEVMDLALYHPDHGFYSAGGAAGRRGDFVTSVEVGPLFGAVVARALDEWWDELGRPDPYVVVEAGAGAGMLARTVLAAGPACGPALRYLLVDRSAALRASQGERLDLTPPELVLGPSRQDDDGIDVPAVLGAGPILASLAELPSIDGPVVVLANELLDNLAFRIVERSGNGWDEVRVGLDPDGRLAELVVPATDDVVALGDALGGGAPVGGRMPVQAQAAAWIREALTLAAPGGRVVVFDYAATSAELLARPDWLRTYAGQARGGSPLHDLGHQDITADVCVDQLARVRPPTADRAQSEWLAAHGLDDLVAEGRRVWSERAHLGDLEALKARSRVGEAEALTDPSGLGAFRVLEWQA